MNDEEPTVWAEHLGPCYTVAGMARRLGWTETDVLEGGKDLTLLMLPTDDEDVYLFPALQFRDGKFWDRLDEILIIFQAMTDDRWMWAYWMTPIARDDRSPEENQRIRDLSREVSLHGVSHKWWWITEAETAEAGDWVG